MCAYQGVRNVCFFRKIWCALFSYNYRFEIRPFASLLRKYVCKDGFLMFSGGREKVHWEKMG